jgi:hypothetical protein
MERRSLPLTRLEEPQVTRWALDALTLRLDGTRAAANTITRKRAGVLQPSSRLSAAIPA